MNCSKCGRELLVSHIEKEVINGEEQVKKVFVCMNEKCSNYSTDSQIKPREKN